METKNPEQIISMIREKLNERDEVIKEQQLQIQELQEEVEALKRQIETSEERMKELQGLEHDYQELLSKLTEVLE